MIMKRFAMRNRVVELALSMGMLARASQAAMISPPDITIPAQAADWTAAITVSQFDPSLGTLNAVFIQTVGNASVNGYLQNNASLPETFSFGMGVEVATLLPNSSLLTADVLAAKPGVFTVPPQGGVAVFGGPATYTGTASTTLSGAEMAPFVGAGSVGLPTETSTVLAFTGGGGNIQANLSTLVGETFHIEYEYSPVPEASTCGVIVGLGCLLALVRRPPH
jgi:hypothetical protein